ncbi:MAG: AAA family ATPase, partial [Xanthobacteraceae bacterium]
MTSARVLRLTLTNFRNYHAASLESGAKTIVLTGPNGAGKTNLIEAISLLSPGRGLRRATLDEVAFGEGDGSWAVAAEIEGALGLATLGIDREDQAIEEPPAFGRRAGEQAIHGRHEPEHAQMVGKRGG